MLTRREATTLLLESYLDYLPSQYRSSLKTVSGPAPSRSIPCPTCLQMRKIIRGRRLLTCPTCEGQGVVRRKKGDPAWDEYIREEVVQSDGQPKRCATLAELDREIARIQMDEAQREGRFDARDELSWVRKRRSLRAHGDYEALERSIQLCAHRDLSAARAVWQTFVLGWDYPSDTRRDDAARGLDFIEATMPSEPRVPPWITPDPQARKLSLWHGKTPRHELSRAQRDEEIRRLAQEGESKTKLAMRFNVGRQHIHRIISSAAA